MHKGDVIDVKFYSQLMHWYRWQDFKLPLFNETARIAMGIKNFVNQRNTKNKIQVSEKNLDRFFETQRLFFGFSTFRSGSTFLTDLLASEVKNSKVLHEPNINDYWSYPKVLQSKKHAENYVANYRKKDIFERIAPHDYSIYGELNPFFVLHCKAVKKMIPTAFLFHLVRDGRDVVRSNFSREVLGNKDPMTKLIQPPKENSYHDEWQSFTRFEKICWKWLHENKLLRETTRHTIQFEQLISDFEYFNSKINQPLKINVSKESWAKIRTKPKHASLKHRLPHWTNWSDQHKRSFERICGDEMRNCGYEISWEANPVQEHIHQKLETAFSIKPLHNRSFG